MILLAAYRGAVHVPRCLPEQTKEVAPRRDKTKTAAGRSTLRCLLTHRLFQADKQFLESNRSFWARGNMHMDIIPMHISHIIIAVPRRFMLPSSSLYFAEAGRIITLLPSNVNPFFSFLHFS